MIILAGEGEQFERTDIPRKDLPAYVEQIVKALGGGATPQHANAVAGGGATGGGSAGGVADGGGTG